MKDRLAEQTSAAAHLDALEDLLGELEGTARGDRGVTVYPQRVTREPTAVSMSPSQALRYAEDPGRTAAAERTATPRQVVQPDVSMAALWSASGAAEPALRRPEPHEPLLEVAPLPAPPPAPVQVAATDGLSATVELQPVGADEQPEPEWDEATWADVTWDDQGWEDPSWDSDASEEQDASEVLDESDLALERTPPSEVTATAYEADPQEESRPWWVAAQPAPSRWRRLLHRS